MKRILIALAVFGGLTISVNPAHAQIEAGSIFFSTAPVYRIDCSTTSTPTTIRDRTTRTFAARSQALYIVLISTSIVDLGTDVAMSSTAANGSALFTIPFGGELGQYEHLYWPLGPQLPVFCKARDSFITNTLAVQFLGGVKGD